MAAGRHGNSYWTFNGRAAFSAAVDFFRLLLSDFRICAMVRKGLPRLQHMSHLRQLGEVLTGEFSKRSIGSLPSWNQIITWLDELESSRQAAASASRGWYFPRVGQVWTIPLFDWNLGEVE